MEDVLQWTEEHPAIAAIIGVGGVFLLLWLFGAFSSGSSNSGASNLAAAYYAAEAQQATAGAQLQAMSIQATNQTAQVADQANAAVAIAQADATASTTINGQNASASTTINGQNIGLGLQQSSDALLATQANDTAAYMTAVSNNQTSQLTTAMQTVIPAEMAYTGGQATLALPGGTASLYGQGFWNVNTLRSQGYSPAQVKQMTGL